MKTDMENYEERFVDYMEGQLDAAEMKEVETFVAQHPELEEDFKLFCSSKLTPDTSIVFTKKESLMRTKTVVKPLFVRVASIAASIAVLIGIGFYYLKAGQDTMSFEFPKATSHLNGIVAKSKPQYTPAPKPEDLTVATTVTKTVTTTETVIKTESTPLHARSETIPTLEPIKSVVVFNEAKAELNYREPKNYLAVLEPVDDTEESVLSALSDDLYENTQKAKSSLYKKTAKAFLSAVYTADCYINETVKDLKELASR